LQAHILMAQLQLKRDNFKGAAQSLEHALSHNFEVRDSVVYHLLKSRISEKLGDMDEAFKVLDSAMSLPGVRNVRTCNEGKENGKKNGKKKERKKEREERRETEGEKTGDM
jgi:lipopolysaccharide biosynthesis regulator YciM